MVLNLKKIIGILSKKTDNAYCVVQDGKLIIVKKEPLSGNALFGCGRASKFENERVSQFVPISFGDLIQQVCNS